MVLNSPKGLPPAAGAHLSDHLNAAGRNLLDGSFPLPTLVLRESALKNNLAMMAAFTAEHNLLLAPHAKTTMSPQIIHRQLAAGAWGMTVATVWQAAQVANMGIDRVIIASEVADPGSLSLLDHLLHDRPDLTVWIFVDSTAVVDLLGRYVRPCGRLHTLVEVGLEGGRTGVRSFEDAVRLAAHAAKGSHRLAGVGAFEGIISDADTASSLAAVDNFLHLVASVALAIQSELPHETAPEPIVTVGGSSYPDRVATVLGPMLSDSPYRTILRSGCYVTHDSGAYEASSPFGHQQRLPYTLEAALELWAAVISRPEPTLAIVGMGKRDVSHDAGMPVVLDCGPRALQGDRIPRGSMAVRALNDQHAYLTVAADEPLTPGELLRFGISHPCTTFDKWRAIPIVNDDYEVVDVAYTCF